MKNEFQYLSRCGRYYCALCDYHLGTIVSAAKKLLPYVEQTKSLRLMADLYNTCDFDEFLKGIKWLSSEEEPCKGCRFGGGWSWWPDCPSRNCSVQKGVDFCFQCEEFPCQKLSEEPLIEHKKRIIATNKEIKSIGIENWIEQLKNRYLKSFTHNK